MINRLDAIFIKALITFAKITMKKDCIYQMIGISFAFGIISHESPDYSNILKYYIKDRKIL